MSTSLLRTVKITQCALGSLLNGRKDKLIDLRPFILQLDLFENIFSSSITGALYLADAVSLSARLPLTGLDILFVEFSVMDASGTEYHFGKGAPLMFHVFSQRERVFLNTSGLSAYRLGLVTPEFTSSVKEHINKRYTNQPIEAIVGDVLTNIMRTSKPLTAEPTSTPITYTVPGMSPHELIAVLSERAKSKPVNGISQANYVFFETLAGFQFKSISALIREGKSDEVPVVRKLPAGLGVGTTGKFVNAEDIQITHAYDALHHAHSGYFQSRTVAVDILAGAYQNIDRKFNAPFTKETHLNAHPPYPFGSEKVLSTPETKTFLVHSSALAHKLYGTLDDSITPNHREDTIDNRNRQLQELRQQRVLFVAPGIPTLSAGKLVYIQIPKMREATESNVERPVALDEYRSGYHLLVGVRHSLVNNNGQLIYNTSAEAYSDSLSKAL